MHVIVSLKLCIMVASLFGIAPIIEDFLLCP